MSRAERLRAEAELVDLEEQYAAAKPTVERCETCGRRKRHEPNPEFDALKAQVAAARAAYREGR